MNYAEVAKAVELQKYLRVSDFSKARALIWNLCQDERRRLTRAGQEYGIRPAIIVGIEQSDREVVEFLLNECNADIEEQLWNERTIGQVSSSPMSPLEFANFTEKYKIFELLLSSGADPTRLINDRKIKASIWRNEFVSLQSLQILSDLGADIKTADDNGLTCLMHAVEYTDRCRFLVEKGVDVKFKNNNGDTALHLAVKCQCYATARLLLGYGADPCSKNDEGYSPLHLVCIKGFEGILELLLEAVEDKTRHVEAYQLLGTTFDDTTKAISAWRKAIEVSSAIPNQASPVTLNTPFGIAVEATSFSELDALEQDRDLFMIQDVVLTYKIFGPNHDRFFHSIELKAELFFAMNLLDQSLQMRSFWLQMMNDSALTQTERHSRLERFFTEMHLTVKFSLKPNVTVNVGSLYEFAEAVVQVLRGCTVFTAKEFLVDMISQFLFVDTELGNELEVRRFVRAAVRLIGQCRERTVLIDILRQWFRDGVSDPRLLSGVAVLLECGVDVDERDQNGNNVVHYLLECRSPLNFNSAKHTCIAAKFVEHGVHLDSRNRKGMTTAECLQKLGVKVRPPVNLMCLAARVNSQHKIEVQGILPKALIDFIEMH